MTLGDNIPTWNFAVGVAAAAIIGCVAFDRLGPKPKIGDTVKKQEKQLQDLRLHNAQANADLAKAQKSIETHAWPNAVADVGPAVLDRVNREATAKGVKVSTFRPQRVQDAAPLKAAEFTVSVQGPFLAVVSFVKSLESPESKIVVTSAQVSSTDAAASLVSASIGLVAFVNEPVVQRPRQGVNNG